MQNTYLYILSCCKKYTIPLIFGFIFLIGAKIASTTEPIILRNIINDLTTNASFGVILILLISYFSIKLIEIFSEFIRDWILAPVIMGISRDFEKEVFTKLLKLPISYHVDQKTGAAARAVTRGSQAVEFILDFSISQFLPPVFELIFVTVVLFKLYSWQFSVITLVTIVLYTIFTIWGTEKRVVYRGKSNDNNDASSAVLVDSVLNMDTVKYFAQEKNQFNKFSFFKNKWFNFAVIDNRVFASIYSGQGLILLTGLGLILYLAVLQTTKNIMSVGDLVLVTTYIVRLTAPITTLGFIYGRFKNSFADIANMTKILNEKNDIIEPVQPVEIKNPKGNLTFERVSFNYHKNKKVIQDLSFEIKPGTRVAFVGPSGAGKSTIAKLIFRLYEPTTGSILIDGVNINEIGSENKAKIVSIVPQDPALFNDTIENNIKFGAPKASKNALIKATKSAQIHDFITSLPEGYNTMVGERGVKVSGGERQRIAIARAILCNPKILIFDEATSNLDSHNEEKVLETINNVTKGRTSISIAHRLSTIVKSDIIYVLKNGIIVEKGNHKELLSTQGVYANLWNIQINNKQDE